MNTEHDEWRFIARFVSESDAIENIQTDENKIYKSLCEGKIPSDGHVRAIMTLRDEAAKRTGLADEIIFRTQALIVSDQEQKGERKLDPRDCGAYRSVNIEVVSGHIVIQKNPEPEDVPLKMASWIERVNFWQKAVEQTAPRDNLKQIARFHFEYERIHPFVDGNGRSGRALAYWMLRFASIPPIIFTSRDKIMNYYRCFKDPKMMINYFENRLKSSH